MRSSIIGTLFFVALFMATNAILFGWTPGAHWRLYIITALLHFVVSEAVRRKTVPAPPSTRA